MAAQEGCEGNPVTWAFFWLEFLLMVFILSLSVARWSSRGQGVQRLGQELICEEWAWQDQLLEGKFKSGCFRVMRTKTGVQGGGQWDAEQEDTEIINTTETAWSIENR